MFSNIPDLRTLPGKFLTAPDVVERPDFPSELKKLEENMALLEKKQKLLDSEQELLDKEESLAQWCTKLKEHEKAVEEAEVLLEKRESLVKRRSQEIDILNHDLLTLRQDLERSVENAEKEVENSAHDKEKEKSENETFAVAINSPEAATKARRHWQLARRHLIDKVSLLEATVQRYRTQVASSSATITAKEMVINKLQTENTNLKDELKEKEKRLKQIEARLALSVQEKAKSEEKLELLLEELQNIDLTSSSKMLSGNDTSTHSPSKKKGFPKASHFSFLNSSHSSNGSPFSLSFRKGAKGNKQHIEKDLAKPTSPKPDRHGITNHSAQNSKHNSSFNEANGSFDGDDSGSKACRIM